LKSGQKCSVTTERYSAIVHAGMFENVHEVSIGIGHTKSTIRSVLFISEVDGNSPQIGYIAVKMTIHKFSIGSSTLEQDILTAEGSVK